MKRILFLLPVLFFASCSTYQVNKVGANNPTKNGRHYYLPKTILDIVVTYEETTNEVSPYSTNVNYTTEVAKIAGPLNLISSNSKAYKIVDVEIVETTIPDNSQLYYIQFNRTNALFLNKKYLFETTNQGILTSGLTESEDYTVDFMANTISTAGSIAAKVFFGGGAGAAAPGGGPNSEIAWLVQRFNEIRTSKMNLLTGVYANGYDSFGDLMKELIKEEETLEKLIGGTITKKIKKQGFRIDPSIGTTTITNFAQAAGIGSGNPINLNISTLFNENVKIAAMTAAKVQEVKDRNIGIYFKEPAIFLVEVTYNNETLKKLVTNLPQFAEVSFLPSKIGTTKNSIGFTIDPKTGVLLKMDASSSGPSMDAIKALNSSLSELPTQLKNKPKADFEDMEKRIKEMELMIKEKGLQKQLDSLNKSGS